MSRSPEAKERDRLAAVARRAAKKGVTAEINKDLARVMPGKPVAVIGEPIPTALREAVTEPAVVTTPPVPKARKAAPAKKAAAKAPNAPAKPRGGARKGAGAPTGATVRMRVITFKGTEEHYKAFHAAGAGAWLRGVLDAGVAAKHIKVPK